jgi:hypothetical protein
MKYGFVLPSSVYTARVAGQPAVPPRLFSEPTLQITSHSSGCFHAASDALDLGLALSWCM